MESLFGLNDFAVYKDNSSDTLHTDYVYPFALGFERVADKVGWTMFFQRYWYHSITISVVYYLAVRGLQRFMRHREPFSLQKPLFYWNAALALFSAVGCVRFAEDFLVAWARHGLSYSLCHSCNPDGVAAFWSLAFAISKVVELGDTLFIVLRKRPLIFLHYYHHAAVLVYTTHSGAEHTAPGQAFITMNYLAHAFMYSYYAYCATGKRLPRWVSMGVTSLQTAQMFAGVAVSCFVYYLKVLRGEPCQQSLANLYLAFLIYATFAALFVQFFVSAYLTSSKRKRKAD